MDTYLLMKNLNRVFRKIAETDNKYICAWLDEEYFSSFRGHSMFNLKIQARKKIDENINENMDLYRYLKNEVPEELDHIDHIIFEINETIIHHYRHISDLMIYKEPVDVELF